MGNPEREVEIRRGIYLDTDFQSEHLRGFEYL